MEIPEALKTGAFQEAWSEWWQHRLEINKAMTPLASKKQLAKLESWGEARSVAAINHSIEKQWTGIFEESNGSDRGLRKFNGVNPEHNSFERGTI